MYQILCLVILSWCKIEYIIGECHGPQMKLLSDDPRRTCTDISASKHTIEYTCTSLIKDFPKAMIRYCPIEVCMENGTWSKPSISCALSECYEVGHSWSYVGHRMCTSSGRHCQRWDSQEPHRHKFKTDESFPDHSIQLSEGFCRDPDGSKGAPWCFTKDPNKKWEFCGIKKCSDIVELDSCGQKKDEEEDADVQVTTTPADEEEDKRSSYESTAVLKTCPDRLRYNTIDNHRIRSKLIHESEKRSVIECAKQCSKMAACRAFTYRPKPHTCYILGGREYLLLKSSGYKSGVKFCHP